MTNGSKQRYRYGDRVAVSYPTGELPGVVLEAYGTGVLARVLVQLAIVGSDGEVLDDRTISVLPSEVRPIEDASNTA